MTRIPLTMGSTATDFSLYGNMPLIEPQESREVKKVEEFVIAIDTSMSCSGELVKHFFEGDLFYSEGDRELFQEDQYPYHPVR